MPRPPSPSGSTAEGSTSRSHPTTRSCASPSANPRSISPKRRRRCCGSSLARARSGSEVLTALERQVAERAAIRTFITRVTAVEQLGPELVQVTCGGGDLQTFAELGPDQFVYVLAPPAGRSELTIDASFSWSAYEAMPEAERPVGAYYTVRRWRPDVAEIDLVVVTHGDDGEGSRWARHVTTGSPVALWGPRRVFDPPSSTDRYVLVGDDTGVHAYRGDPRMAPFRCNRRRDRRAGRRRERRAVACRRQHGGHEDVSRRRARGIG